MQIVAEPEFRASPKDRFWLALDLDRILLFDKSTGRAVVNGKLSVE
jgi:hypothetical protein